MYSGMHLVIHYSKSKIVGVLFQSIEVNNSGKYEMFKIQSLNIWILGPQFR